MSVIVDENFVAFRKPDKPNEAFSQDDMDSLLSLLNEMDPDWQKGLAGEFPIELEPIAELLLEMSPEDQKQAEVIFRNFFQAGTSEDAEENLQP